MQYFNHLDISIHQIKMFIQVAELGSFSKAALAMNAEQSTLSKRISALEQALGCQLFLRNTRPVKLTEEGDVLLWRWKKLVYDFERCVEDVSELHRKRENRLSVCTVDSINTVSTMPLMRTQMLQKHSELNLTFEYIPFSQWRDKIVKREIDLVITVNFEATNLNSDAFCYEPLTTIPKSVCMLKTNPLSQKQSLTFDDLKDQFFVLVSPMESPAYADYVKGLCKNHGFDPHVARYISNAHGLFSGIQNNDEVVICDRFFRDFDNPMIANFDLPDTKSGIIAVWNKHNNNPYIKSFIETFQTTQNP